MRKRAPFVPAIGETWFVSIRPQCTVPCVLLEEVTAKTVVLRHVQELDQEQRGAYRYRRSDVKWLEKVE